MKNSFLNQNEIKTQGEEMSKEVANVNDTVDIEAMRKIENSFKQELFEGLEHLPEELKKDLLEQLTKLLNKSEKKEEKTEENTSEDFDFDVKEVGTQEEKEEVKVSPEEKLTAVMKKYYAENCAEKQNKKEKKKEKNKKKEEKKEKEMNKELEKETEVMEDNVKQLKALNKNMQLEISKQEKKKEEGLSTWAKVGLGVTATAAVAAGGYYLYKNFFANNNKEDELEEIELF